MGKYLIVLMILAVSVFMAFSCSHQAHRQESDANNMDEVAGGNIRFAFDLIRNTAGEGENIVLSPFSISTALAMTYAGARGQTGEEMGMVMHFDRDPGNFSRGYSSYLNSVSRMAGDDLNLNIANSLWAQYDYTFLDSYFETLERYYGSSGFMVDFTSDTEKVRLEINEWVYRQTGENISDLLEPGVLTIDTRLVLANAIHFRGQWLKEFDRGRTREGDFYTYDDQSVKADFMNRTDTLLYYGDDLLQAVKLPYAGEGFSMLFILPARGVSPRELFNQFDAGDYQDMLANMEVAETELFIPRFKAESKVELDKLLSSMGMRQAFTNQADFSGITGGMDLKIDRIIHQALIEVSEEGTEAAAATAVVIIRKSLLEEDSRKVFRADRPFIYFLVENRYNSILFSGITSRP